jgi:hypothetical protein
MAIVKLTKSGKGVLFIDDDGNTFVCSLGYFESLKGRTNGPNFVLLSRLPFKNDSKGFKKSPLYDPEGLAKDDTLEDKAGLGKDIVNAVEQQKGYKDKNIWS